MLIQQSRTKLAVVAVLAGVLTLVLAFLGFVSAHLPALWSTLAVSLFAPVTMAMGAVAVMHALAWARPGTLSADEDGITHRTWRNERHIAWEDVEEIFVLAPENRLRSPGVRLKSGARRVVSFGRCWEKTAEEVVEGMTQFLPTRGGEEP